MANQNYQSQNHLLLPHPSLTSPQSSSSSSAAYQHFQPWRNCIKTEKDSESPGSGGAGELLFNCSPRLNSGPGASFQHHQQQQPQHQMLAYGPQSGVSLGQKLFTRETNPELDLKMQQCIEEGNCVGDYAKKQIVQILESISLLKPPERVLLYLRMPGANCETDPLRQPQNPLGARSEINHTINWVRSHLEPDPNVSIPKKDVYDDYTAFCGRNNIKPLSTADFGKVMKQVFPTVRPRRLGTRGHSRYCYAAMRKATRLDPPMLPDLFAGSGGAGTSDNLMPNNGPSSVSGEMGYSPTNRNADAMDTSWRIIQSWAQKLLHVKFNSVKELADHIVQFNLINEDPRDGDHEMREASGKETSKKVKDKRKQMASSPEKSNSPTKKRRKKRKKDESSVSSGGGPISGGGGGCAGDGFDSETAVRVKREVDSANDEDQIIDLKMSRRDADEDEDDANSQMGPKMPIKLLLNDVPIDASTTATDSDELQIENIYCKKVRQAQQAKGLWFQQQQQQQLQPQQAGHNSVIVTPHTFSQPEIPSPSMLNQMNRQQFPVDRDAVLPKSMQKRDGSAGDDNIPSHFILPRERVISLCTLDKDALDDYLPQAGDNSQEAEIMQYFDENSSNGQSTGGTEDSSPKVVDEGRATESVQMEGSAVATDEYPMFAGMKQGNLTNDGEEKLSQLRQMLHMNIQAPGSRVHPTVMNAGGGGSGASYPGPASVSLSLLSQRHNNSSSNNNSAVGYGPVGMDLTQGDAPADQPLKKRRLPPGELAETAIQRRFVPIAQPPQSFRTSVDYTKVSPGVGRQSEFLTPKMAAALKHQQQQQQQQHMQQQHQQMDSPLALVHSDNDRKTALSRSKYNLPSPSAAGVVLGHRPHPHEAGSYETKALNMSTYEESRSQSVPLNYRQSPVQVTSSNDGASWSSSYQNTNNANSSACSSVAPTPIPSDYNDFTEMINIWENDATPPIPQQRQDQQQFRGGGQVAMDGSENKQLYKDKNNNSSSSDNIMTDAFVEEMKSFGQTSSGITSRSVPSTPVPGGGVPYYPKAYFNGGNSGVGMFSNYGQSQQQHGRCFDVSKSVPTTPIGLPTVFRYSPVAEVMNRRDILINGNINLDKALESASASNFGYGGGDGGDQGVASGIQVGNGGGNARIRRIEKIAEDRKGAATTAAAVVGESLVKDMSPLDEEDEEEEGMGYDPMMDPDLMNQFKNEF